MKPRGQTKLFRWIKEHPGTRLPASVKGIAEITGLPRDQVKQALYRRSKEVERSLRSLPMLMQGKGVLTTGKKRIPVAAIAEYDLRVLHYSLEIVVWGTLRDGSAFKAKVSKADYRKMCLGEA